MSIPFCRVSLIDFKSKPAGGTYRRRTFCCARLISVYLARSGKRRGVGASVDIVNNPGSRRSMQDVDPATERPGLGEASDVSQTGCGPVYPLAGAWLFVLV